VQLEIDITMNTSHNTPRHLLEKVSPTKAENALEDWANVVAEYGDKMGSKEHRAKIDDGIARLIQRYPDIFGEFISDPPPNAPSRIRFDDWYLVAHVQRFLRLAWDAPDARHREWYIFKARDHFQSSTVVMPLFNKRMASAANLEEEIKKELTEEEDRARLSPPTLGSFEQLMYFFQRISGRARHCPNPECPAPYFFAKKKGQRYCSAKCSAPAQREQKRIWWEQNRGKRRS
jgi:hypothetical protein